MSPADLSGMGSLVSLGIGGVIAVLIWKAYQALVDRVLDTMKNHSDAFQLALVHNTEALQRVAFVVDQNTRTVEVLVSKVDDMDDRMTSLENCTHGEEGHASCPYLHKERA